MDKDQREKIRAMTTVLSGWIESAEAQADSIRVILEKFQDECDREGHEGPEVYRGYRIGQCSICQRQFSDKQAVDQMLIE